MECEDELEIIEKESREYKQAMKILAQSRRKTLADSEGEEDEHDDNIGTPSYSETTELLQKWEQIREKYLPNGDSYKKQSMMQNLTSIFGMNVDKFE